MPPTPSISPSTVTGRSPAPGPVQPYGELLARARRSASAQAFLAGAVGRIGQEFASPYTALHVQLGTEVVQEEAHEGSGDPRFWKPAVQQFLTESLAAAEPRAKLLSARGANLKVALLAAPLTNAEGDVEGAVALVCHGDSARIGRLLQRLEALAAVTASAVALVGADSAPRANAAAPNAALGRAAGVSSPEELAFAITNSLRNRLACEQVSLGLVRSTHVRILSISGLDDVPRRSPGVTHLLAAMEECLDFGEPIVCQQDQGWASEKLTAGHHLHQQWHMATRGDGVASIPLLADGQCVAVLSLRRRSSEPLRREQIDEVRKLVEPFGPALLLVAQARRSLLTHARDAGRHAIATLVGPGQLRRKLLTLLAVAVAGWVVFGTLSYEVVLPARVVPTQQLHVAVPFEGVLARVVVIAGAKVRAGDVLCELDRRDLELERARLQAQRAVLDREQTRALAANEVAAAKVSEANARLVETQLAIIERRLEQTTVRAPFDGVVISGDPRKQVGSVLAQGTPLFDLATLDHWSLEVDAPENVTTALAAGLPGRFASQARPEQTQSFVLARVAPSAEARAGRNVYLVEAPLEAPDDWLRPGMEGLAKVQVGPRPVWWMMLHHVLDYLRLNFWI